MSGGCDGRGCRLLHTRLPCIPRAAGQAGRGGGEEEARREEEAIAELEDKVAGHYRRLVGMIEAMRGSGGRPRGPDHCSRARPHRLVHELRSVEKEEWEEEEEEEEEDEEEEEGDYERVMQYEGLGDSSSHTDLSTPFSSCPSSLSVTCSSLWSASVGISGTHS